MVNHPPRAQLEIYQDSEGEEDEEEEEQVVSSRLHGKLVTLPLGTTSPTRSLPLSPKGTSHQLIPSGEVNARQGKKENGSINFPPHVRSHALTTLDAPLKDSSSAGNVTGKMVGEWEIGESLGQGTSGTVYLARSRKDGTFAAIKKVKRLPQDHKEAALVHREIALMKLVSPHPHLVELFDVYESRSHLYLVTEYCPHGELFQYVTQNALTKVERCRFYCQLLSALLHLSKCSISHRDIKFENLLLYPGDLGYLSIKVGDMGMASLQRDDQLLRTSCGSPHYAAPEVIQGVPYDGSLADVWSAGVCLFAMIARRLPFDHPHIPTLLSMIKEGDYELEDSIEGTERDVVVNSLKKDVKERITLEQLSMHPYAFTNVHVLEARFHQNLQEIGLSHEMSRKEEENFGDFENLDLAVLASLGIVLKVSTLDEVKEMLRDDRNHARDFYSKLYDFRTSTRTPVSFSLQSMYRQEVQQYDDHDDDSMDLSSPPFNPSLFPDPPRPPSPSFSPFDPVRVNIELGGDVASNWNESPPRASLPDSILLHSLARSRSDGTQSLHSAPPAPHKFPSHLACLHDFGPVASAPPQIESFASEPLPLSPRVKQDISRRNSVVDVDQSLPFLELQDSPVSPPNPASLLETSYDRLLDPSYAASTSSPIRVPRKKPSMHQRIRSLLSNPSARSLEFTPSSASPRVSIAQAPAHFRPPSPSPSTSTTSSRLTRSDAYRSLGRALLGKGPKSPAIIPSTSSDAELSYAERIVLETLVPSFSPIPSFSPDTKPKGKGKDKALGGGGGGLHLSPSSFLDDQDGGTKTVKKSAIRKKLSLGMLQFFQDESKSASATPTLSSPSTTPNCATPASKLHKEKRRPKALSIASSNLVAVNDASSTRTNSPNLVKKLSLLAIGPSRSTHLVPPSPLVLGTPTATPPPPPPLASRTFLVPRPRSPSPVLVKPRGSTTLSPPPALVPRGAQAQPPNIPILRRRSTLSSPLSVTIDTSPSSAASSSSYSSPSSPPTLTRQQERQEQELATVQLERDQLWFENEWLKTTLASKEQEMEGFKRRELEWFNLVERALVRTRSTNKYSGRSTSAASASGMRKEASKTEFVDEESSGGLEQGEGEEEGATAEGTREEAEEWVESLNRLSKSFTLL